MSSSRSPSMFTVYLSLSSYCGVQVQRCWSRTPRWRAWRRARARRARCGAGAGRAGPASGPRGLRARAGAGPAAPGSRSWFLWRRRPRPPTTDLKLTQVNIFTLPFIQEHVAVYFYVFPCKLIPKYAYCLDIKERQLMIMQVQYDNTTLNEIEGY